jgi:hypothetical protein
VGGAIDTIFTRVALSQIENFKEVRTNDPITIKAQSRFFSRADRSNANGHSSTMGRSMDGCRN